MKPINDIVPVDYRDPAWSSCPVPGRLWWFATVIGLDRTPTITDIALIHDPCRPDLAPWTGVL